MNLHRIQYGRLGHGAVVEWYGTKRDAAKTLARRKREGLITDVSIPTFNEAVEVPTTKEGLLAWLNRNLTSDNG